LESSYDLRIYLAFIVNYYSGER